MTIKPKLTTVAACRVAGFHRDRFNELVHDGLFACAPKTVPGRARLFDPDDMLALVLFKRLMDDGSTPMSAGSVACTVADAAKNAPEANAISYVETYVGSNTAYPASQVPSPDAWVDTLFSGSTIRKVTTFNVAHLRQIIAQYTEEERAIIGADDGE